MTRDKLSLTEPDRPALSTTPTLAAFVAGRLAEPRELALAQRFDGGSRALSAGEVQRAAAAVAHALRGRGIARGDRVAIVAENSVDWLLADFGILYAGAVVVPVFATAAADQVAFILSDSETKLIFTDTPRRAAAIRAACPDPAVPIVAFESAAGDAFSAFRAEGERHAGDETLLRTYTDGIGADELAVLIYTSGTTGTPKGVMLSHRNLIADVESAFDPQDSTLEPGQIALSVLPFAHVMEHTDALGYLYNGLSLYVTTPERLVEDMRAIRPSYVAFVPRIFERLIAGIVGSAQQAGGMKAKLVPWALEVGTAYQRALRDGAPSLALRVQYALARALVLRKIPAALGLDRLRFFVSGSAPLHRDTALTLAAMGLVVCEGYGLTETAPVVTVNRLADNVLGSVGAPVRGVQIKIAADGEVLVKGPNVMLGYYKLPSRGAAVRRRGLVLHRRHRDARRARSSDDHRPQEGDLQDERRQVDLALADRDRDQAFGLDRAGDGVRGEHAASRGPRRAELGLPAHEARPPRDRDRRADGAERTRARARGVRGRSEHRGPRFVRAGAPRRDPAARAQRGGRRALADAQSQAPRRRAALCEPHRAGLRRGPPRPRKDAGFVDSARGRGHRSSARGTGA